MVRISDLMWGQGTWLCLGKQIAQVEIAKIVFEVSASSGCSRGLDSILDGCLLC